MVSGRHFGIMITVVNCTNGLNCFLNLLSLIVLMLYNFKYKSNIQFKINFQ